MGNPTGALEIADDILLVASNLVANSDPALRGIFHMTASWADFAEVIFAASATRGGPSAWVLIISTLRDLPAFQALLGKRSQWGMAFDYAEQLSPDGLARAYIIGADFVAGHPSVLILGDNIYHGHGQRELLASVSAQDWR